MTWSWRMESTDGGTVDGVPPSGSPARPTPSRGSARRGRTLLSQGVDAVSLLEDDRVVYGPMSLHPAE